MPVRQLPLVTDQIYHIFNRGLDHRPTFTDRFEYTRAFFLINYYRFAGSKLAFSKFLKLSNEERGKILLKVQSENLQNVEVLVFCLMPNHFHFLLKQAREKGISKFLADFQNSYTKYFNIKNERNGPLFLNPFKAVLIETDEQLIHVSRYIHLNPTTSYVVKDFDSLKSYQWSSLLEYLNNKPDICKTETVMSFFKNALKYEEFLRDQVEYQRTLDKIKHLVLERAENT